MRLNVGKKEPTLFSGIPFAAGLDMVPSFLERELGISSEGPLNWQADPRSTVQVQLVRGLPAWRKALRLLDPRTEYFAAAAWTAEKINHILAEGGFPYIQLDPWCDLETFGIAGAITLDDWKWRYPGTGEYKILDRYAGFRLGVTPAEGGIEVRILVECGSAVVIIPTQRQGDYVYLIDNVVPRSGFDLLEACHKLYSSDMLSSAYTGAILPQWYIEPMMVDVSGINGLSAIDSRYNPRIIDQAKFGGETSFRKDGTHFRAAFAAAVRKCICMPDRPGPDDYVLKSDAYALYVRHGSILGVVYAPVDCWSYQDVASPQRRGRGM
jgi:hypothetical protein